MSKPKSEIIPYEVRGADGRKHACAYEFVPSTKRPRAVYLVFDGQRIAMSASLSARATRSASDSCAHCSASSRSARSATSGLGLPLLPMLWVLALGIP